MQPLDFNFLAPTTVQGNKDLKYNLFDFQNHLVSEIGMASKCMCYHCFGQALIIYESLFDECSGFLSDSEVEELHNVLLETKQVVFEYGKNTPYYSITEDQFPSGYQIHSLEAGNPYAAICKFKRLLMKSFAKHQMLIPIVDKSGQGAGDR